MSKQTNFPKNLQKSPQIRLFNLAVTESKSSRNSLFLCLSAKSTAIVLHHLTLNKPPKLEIEDLMLIIFTSFGETCYTGIHG